MDVRVHPRVKKYLVESEEKDRPLKGLQQLGENPFVSRSSLDIKKLKGKVHDIYRLRIGEHRFEYFVEDGTVWIQNAFRRERGYLHIDRLQ